MLTVMNHLFIPPSTDDKRISALLGRRLRGTITPSEAIELENLLADRSRDGRYRAASF
jgi:hypothetical protein